MDDDGDLFVEATTGMQCAVEGCDWMCPDHPGADGFAYNVALIHTAWCHPVLCLQILGPAEVVKVWIENEFKRALLAQQYDAEVVKVAWDKMVELGTGNPEAILVTEGVLFIFTFPEGGPDGA